ncbi:MAG TPA: lipoprotein insertase outer membrane protein LolB [Burkholderiaceae bacterium]
MIRRVGWYFALILMLAGCASITSSPEKTQHPASAYHDTIDIDGRLSVQYQQNGSNEALHGNFSWSQTPKRTVIALSSPLGQTLAVIEVTPDMSILTQSGRPRRMAADPDTLTELALGWPLPIAGMRYWLQGVAIDTNGQRFVASGQSEASAAVSTQDGWQIRYVSWQDGESSSAFSHPKRIDLVRKTQQAGDVSIRLVIDNWQPR